MRTADNVPRPLDHQPADQATLCRYPEHAVTALPAEGAHLIVCHGGSVHQTHTTSLPCYKPFSKLVSDMLASAPTCTSPDLPLVVHALPEDYGTVSESVVYGYPSDGSIVRGREKLSFGVSHDGAHISLRSGPESELSVAFEGGTTLCAQIRPHPTSTASTGAMDAVSTPTEEVCDLPTVQTAVTIADRMVHSYAWLPEALDCVHVSRQAIARVLK